MTRKSRIQEEIKQRRPFASRSMEAATALLRTGDMVRRYYERRVEPYGITFQQYNVLRILRGAGPEGLPTLEIGERMIQEAPGITRLVDRLVKKRLVERDRATDDRRKVICRITPAGLDLVADLDEPCVRWDEELMARLDEEDLEILTDMLDRVREMLSPEAPGGA